MESPEIASIERRAHVLVIKLDGEFDLSDCDRLRDAFSLSAAAQMVVVDFQKAAYIDSSVLRCLVELHQRSLECGVRLALVGVAGTVKHVLEICRLDRLFDIRTSLGDLHDAPAFDGADVRTVTLVSRVAEA